MAPGDRLYRVLRLGVTSPSFIPFASCTRLTHSLREAVQLNFQQHRAISKMTPRTSSCEYGDSVTVTKVFNTKQCRQFGLVLTFTYFMCIVVFAYMYVHHVYVRCPWRHWM